MSMDDFRPWYDALQKPSWTPSPETIGMIWTVLYPIIIAVNVFVFVKFFRKELSVWVLLPFAINIVANVLFTPIQFGLRNLTLALADILLVWVTIIWAMKALWPHYPKVALAFVPYLVWVSIASVAQSNITFMNR